MKCDECGRTAYALYTVRVPAKLAPYEPPRIVPVPPPPALDVDEDPSVLRRRIKEAQARAADESARRRRKEDQAKQAYNKIRTKPDSTARVCAGCKHIWRTVKAGTGRLEAFMTTTTFRAAPASKRSRRIVDRHL